MKHLSDVTFTLIPILRNATLKTSKKFKRKRTYKRKRT